MISPEDSLRLNSLLSLCLAIRIDEYKMCIVGLDKNQKERRMQLNPSGDDYQYLTSVRSFLTTRVLGGMGGYPAYLKRWSRMGGLSLKNLQSLLKLGDTNAIVAIANTTNLPANILPQVWWCATNTDQQAEIGRYLLTKKEVLSHPIKNEISKYLLEFLPFLTTDISALMDTLYLLLHPGLISDEAIQRLWQQGQRKPYILVPFLERYPDKLPTTNNKVKPINNIVGLEKMTSEQGQLFLQTCQLILKKINHEDVLYRSLDVLGNYCAHKTIKPAPTITKLLTQVSSALKTINPTKDYNKIKAQFLLAGVSEKLVISEIATHALSGSTIRKKLSPILTPIQEALTTLTN